MNARLDIALAHWGYIAPLLAPPTNEAEYQGLVESLDALLDHSQRGQHHRSQRSQHHNSFSNADCNP